MVLRAALPILDDAARSPDPDVCPFFRYEHDGELVAPLTVPDDANRCAAIGAARPQSLRQQELVCLKRSHADCPRYLRGAMALQSGPARRPPAVPRATVAALLILVLSAGISFGFVVQRGGIDLPVVGPNPTDSGVAMLATPTPEPGITAQPSSAGSSTPAPTAPPSIAPSPTASSSPTPTPTPSPTPTLEPTPTATPSSTPTPAPTKATSDRYKLLTPCPDRKKCWIYVVRSGDNLFSIAHYFGVPLSTIYAWNPRYASGAHLKAGDQIRMPPPTR